MDDLIESVYTLSNPPPADLATTQVEDWQTTLDQHRQDQHTFADLAKRIYIPSAQGKHKPYEFTRKKEKDDDNTIVATTRLGEESVTTIFLKRTAWGLILPSNNGQIINSNQVPDFLITKALLANSTRISKQGLVQKLKEQRDASSKGERINKKWTSALLKHCCYVELDEDGKAQIGKWEILLDPERGVIINST